MFEENDILFTVMEDDDLIKLYEGQKESCDLNTKIYKDWKKYHPGQTHDHYEEMMNAYENDLNILQGELLRRGISL